jgi:hypothetical protein
MRSTRRAVVPYPLEFDAAILLGVPLGFRLRRLRQSVQECRLTETLWVGAS